MRIETYVSLAQNIPPWRASVKQLAENMESMRLARFWFCNRLDDSILWNENTTPKVLERILQSKLDNGSKRGMIQASEGPVFFSGVL